MISSDKLYTNNQIKNMISSDSEVYSYNNQINNLDDYLKFMREKNISNDILFNRFICLLETYFINISNNLPLNLDPLKLIIEAEVQLNVYPYGRKWENIKINIDSHIKKDFTEKYKIHKNLQIKMESLTKEYLNNNYFDINKKEFNNQMKKLIQQFGEENLPEYLLYKNVDQETYFKTNINYKILKIKKSNFDHNSFEINNWKHLFFKANNEEEIEIRFQHVTGIEFGNLFQYCLKNVDIMFYINRFSLVNRENIHKNLHQRTFYFINDNDDLPFHQTKETLDEKYNNTWKFKVVRSLEKNLLDLTYTNPDKFYKNSFSFYTRPKSHPLHNFILDMSITLDINTDFPKLKYRIELEKRKEGVYTEEILINALLFVLQIMQQVNKDDLIDSNIKSNIYKIIKNPKTFVNKVLPFTVTQKNVLDFIYSDYYITNKLDGERVILLIDTLLGVYIIYLDGTKKRILNSFILEMNLNINIMFDCELFDNVINIFDIITINTTFKNRLSLINSYIPFLNNLFSKIIMYKFAIKDYIKVNKMKDIEIFYDNMLLTKNLDGIILQPNDNNYKNSSPLKLKPPNLNTLDIIIKNPINNDPTTFEEEINLKLERITNYLEYDFNILLFVAEVINIKNKYYPIKIRFEKEYGNPENILKSNALLTKTDIKDILTGKGIILAKKIINYYKQKILNENQGVLVDVGSGQGGDINKWVNYKKIFAIERDDNMIDLFKERQKNSSLNIELIHSNFEDVKINEPVDVMTIFFSVNTICKSINSLKQYVKKIKEINPRKIILLFNDYNKLKNIKSDYLKIKELDHGYIITIENTFVENILEYEFDVQSFIKELGYFHKFKDLYNDYPLLSKFENDFLKTIKYVEFAKKYNELFDGDKFEYENISETFVYEDNFVYDNENNDNIYEKTEKDSDIEEIDYEDEDDKEKSDIENDYDGELVDFNIPPPQKIEYPVIEVFNIESTTANIENIKQFWPVPSETTNILIKQNELTFNEFLDNVSSENSINQKTDEHLWQLLDVFSKGNFDQYSIFTSLNPFTFLFQNIYGKELKFSDFNLLKILYNPNLLNSSTTNKKIFIGTFDNIPTNWNDSILIIVNEISIKIIEYLSTYDKIIIYRTFLVPGMVYECHEKKNIHKIPERINGILECTNNLIMLNEQNTIITPKIIYQIKIFDIIFIQTSFNIKCFYNLIINSDSYKYFQNNENIKSIYKSKKYKNKNPFPNISGIDNEIKALKKRGFTIMIISHGSFINQSLIEYNNDYLIIYNKKILFKSNYLTKLNSNICNNNIYYITSEYMENIKGNGSDIYIYINENEEKFIIQNNATLDIIKNMYASKNRRKVFFDQFFKDEYLNPDWYTINTNLSNYKLIGFIISNKPITDVNNDENNLYFKRFNRYYKYTKEEEIFEIEKFQFDTIPYLALYQK